MGNLKDYRENELKKYILANVISMLFLSGELNLNISDSFIGINSLGIKITSIVALISLFYLYVMVFDSLLSDKMKFHLVYLWRKFPGETIFDDIQQKDGDIRFTALKALDYYKDIYSEIENISYLREKCRYENQEWYRIFSSVKNEGAVISAHRDYLMLRDMHVATWLLIFIYGIFGGIGVIPLNLSIIAFLLFFIVITNIATIHKGKRFVYNVIACDMGKEKKD